MLHRHSHPDVHLSNVSKVVTDFSITPQTYEEINLNHEYEYIGFQNRPTEHDTGNIGEFAYSGCAAYGVHLGDQGAVSGNMDESQSGTGEQVVSSAHEMVRTESYKDMYMSGDGENEGNEDGGKN